MVDRVQEFGEDFVATRVGTVQMHPSIDGTLLGIRFVSPDGSRCIDVALESEFCATFLSAFNKAAVQCAERRARPRH
jgi:hypothetical protein